MEQTAYPYVMRIYLSALGCKLNQSEMETLARQFLDAGHLVVSRPEDAEICILNTCTVTHIAARKSRQALRRLRRASPHTLLVATGCYAEMSPAEIKALGGVDFIFGNKSKAEIVALLTARVPGLARSHPAPEGTHFVPGPIAHTRAFVKIQDGCDNACTYCIVAQARGAAVSRPSAEIMQEIRERLAEGYKEVVLTGVHVGSYGRKEGESLSQLVRAILAETAVPRLRLSSIDPGDLTDDLLALWREPRLCRHLHLPLQSGCDATLERMGRRYTAGRYAELLARARAAAPGLAVTTDVIVGFPGETEAEFEASLAFVQAQGFARLHVFPYSPRAGTLAATLPDQIPPPIKEARGQAMRRVGMEATQRFVESFLGRTLDVLWEAQAARSADGAALWSGLTDNYIRVYAESISSLGNTIAPARLVSAWRDGAWARLCAAPV